MGNAVGQFLGHAVGVAISPLALVAVILILGVPRGRANALAFAIGWLVAVAAVFGIVLIIGTAWRCCSRCCPRNPSATGSAGCGPDLTGPDHRRVAIQRRVSAGSMTSSSSPTVAAVSALLFS